MTPEQRVQDLQQEGEQRRRAVETGTLAPVSQIDLLTRTIRVRTDQNVQPPVVVIEELNAFPPIEIKVSAEDAVRGFLGSDIYDMGGQQLLNGRNLLIAGELIGPQSAQGLLEVGMRNETAAVIGKNGLQALGIDQGIAKATLDSTKGHDLRRQGTASLLRP